MRKIGFSITDDLPFLFRFDGSDPLPPEQSQRVREENERQLELRIQNHQIRITLGLEKEEKDFEEKKKNNPYQVKPCAKCGQKFHSFMWDNGEYPSLCSMECILRMARIQKRKLYYGKKEDK